MVDGYPREFLVYVPARVQQPAPLVIMYHGSTGTGPQFLRISGWREMADEVGLVAVFPTGLEYFVLDERRMSTKWNDYSLASEVDLERKPRGYPASAPWPADDVAFTRAMVTNVGSLLALDGARLCVAGFSNGSGMVTRLAVEASDLFSGAGGNFSMLLTAKTPQRQIPRIVTVGNEDDRLMSALGQSKPLPVSISGLRAFPGVDTALRAELATWGLSDPPTALVERPAIAAAEWTTPAQGAASGAAFRLVVLRGLAHNFPNGRNNDAGFVAAREYWNFWVAHPMQ
jgi:polyhydroxybutyrate depolymerase